MTPSVTAPGDTNLSDATAIRCVLCTVDQQTFSVDLGRIVDNFLLKLHMFYSTV